MFFKFINRSWCDIGDTAVVNLNSVASLTSNFDTNVYHYAHISGATIDNVLMKNAPYVQEHRNKTGRVQVEY